MPKKAPAKRPARKSKDRLLLEKLMDRLNQEEFYEELCDDGKKIIREISEHTGVKIDGDTTRDLEVDLHVIEMSIPDTDSFNNTDFQASVVLKHIPSGTVVKVEDIEIYDVIEP